MKQFKQYTVQFKMQNNSSNNDIYAHMNERRCLICWLNHWNSWSSRWLHSRQSPRRLNWKRLKGDARQDCLIHFRRFLIKMKAGSLSLASMNWKIIQCAGLMMLRICGRKLRNNAGRWNLLCVRFSLFVRFMAKKLSRQRSLALKYLCGRYSDNALRMR